MTDAPDKLPPGPSSSNPDEWRLHLSIMLDNRATHPNGLTYAAMDVSNRIQEREREIERLRLLVSNADDEHDDQCHRLDELRARVAELTEAANIGLRRLEQLCVCSAISGCEDAIRRDSIRTILAAKPIGE